MRHRRAYRNPQEHRADAPCAAGDPGASSGGKPFSVILDDLALRERCATNAVEGCFTPTYVSWAHLIQAHVDALRELSIAISDYATRPSARRSAPTSPGRTRARRNLSCSSSSVNAAPRSRAKAGAAAATNDASLLDDPSARAFVVRVLARPTCDHHPVDTLEIL